MLKAYHLASRPYNSMCLCSVASSDWLSATAWTEAYPSPLPMRFPRQRYWRGLLFPSPRDLPDPRRNPCLLSFLQVDSLPTEPHGKAHNSMQWNQSCKGIIIITASRQILNLHPSWLFIPDSLGIWNGATRLPTMPSGLWDSCCRSHKMSAVWWSEYLVATVSELSQYLNRKPYPVPWNIFPKELLDCTIEVGRGWGEPHPAGKWDFQGLPETVGKPFSTSWLLTPDTVFFIHTHTHTHTHFT